MSWSLIGITHLAGLSVSPKVYKAYSVDLGDWCCFSIMCYYTIMLVNQQKRSKYYYDSGSHWWGPQLLCMRHMEAVSFIISDLAYSRSSHETKGGWYKRGKVEAWEVLEPRRSTTILASSWEVVGTLILQSPKHAGDDCQHWLSKLRDPRHGEIR